MLTKDSIFSLPALEKITIPAWGEIYIRTITVADSIELEEKYKELGKKGPDLVVLTVIYAVCDEQGNRLFTLDDYAKLSQQPYGAMLGVFNHVNAKNATVDELKKS